MKRAFAAGLIIVVFALCGCARQQYTTLEEAVRAGAKIEKGITIDGADVSDMDIVAARRRRRNSGAIQHDIPGIHR